MSRDKVTFGVTSKGKPLVIYKQHEFVKHRKYASGNIQWRCKFYQSSKCKAKLTTRNDEVVNNCDPEHNHSGNQENILARQVIGEMKDKICDISATSNEVIASVVNQLEPDVLMALPRKRTLTRTLNRKRQKLLNELGTTLPSLSRVPRQKRFLFNNFMESNIYIGTSVRGLTEEIMIPVPWGIIAGKVYGDSSLPPVLCLHGWLDNCNTFDTLIPLLPKDKYYVFVDLPGHGLSSHLPVGFFYTSHHYVAVVERISNYFHWKCFSLLSHSLGGNISTIYAGTFPEKIDKLIVLDVLGILPYKTGYDPDRLRSSIESYMKYENELDTRTPSAYDYDEAKARLLKANSSLTSEAADVLLERGTAKQEDGTFKFLRDFRHNFRNPTLLSLSSGLTFLSKIRAETLLIIATEGMVFNYMKDSPEFYPELREKGYNSCEFYSRVDVEGKHHVHLCNPEKVIEHIKPFLDRPPRSGLTTSSL